MSEVIYNFDTTQWTNLKTSIKSQSQPDRSVSFCADYGFCNQTYNYMTYGYGKYTNYYQTSSYTNHSNSHNQYFPGYYQHANSSTPGHYNYSGYSDCSQANCSRGGHFNYSQTTSGHSNTHGHGNVCTNSCSNYSQTTSSCYDVSSHSNSLSYCYQCSESYGYNNAIGLTTNMPNAPVLLGTESGDVPRLAKTVTLALFAYDKDYNLGVTQVEKETYYDLYIQKIQDDSGNLLTGQPLTKILANQKESAVGEGLTFSFNSTAYSDGYYRLIAVSRNAPGSYYMQDIPTDSITASGNYNGSDLYSGLLFNAGERPDKPIYTNLKGGTTYNMVTVNKVRIKQNTKSFFEIKNAATTILNFVFANDDAAEAEEGRYSKTANVKQIYGQSGIADGDTYITLRGWQSGLTARLEVEEPDVAQYIKVVGALYRKSDGTLIPGSSVTAQFPTNKSSASAYVELMQGGGSGVKREAYIYWPATLFSASNLVNGMEDVEIRTTVYEYENSSGTTLADTPQTSSSVQLNADGSESATKAVFSVDKFSPSVQNNSVQDTWLQTSTVTVTVDDRFLNNAVNASGTTSNLDRILVNVVDRTTGTVLSTYDWSTANGVIPANATNFAKSITITSPSWYENVGLDITAWDKVGNKKTQSISNIKIDNTATTITISPLPSAIWSKTQIIPGLNFSKPGGAPFTRIQIAETNSATPPVDGSAAWKNFASGLGLNYSYTTTDAGRTTNEHYVHVIVDDGTHATIRQTFGPYRVDLEAPSVNITSTAGTWRYQPTVTVAATESPTGSKLKSVKYTWKKTDGTSGGTQTIDLSAANLTSYNGTYTIDIPADTYESNISCTVEVTDNAGNVFTNTITDLRADKTTPAISINPVADSNWHNTKISTITTISKSTGAPCTSIKIAETTSPTRPADADSAWKNVAISNGGAIYPNQTTGQISGQHYVHVWVEKGTYDPLNPSSSRVNQTFGPYKVDLILPEMTDFEPAGSYAQKNGWYWQIPTFNINVVDNGGSLMKDLRYIISPSPTPPAVDGSWTAVSPATTLFPVNFPAGERYVHVFMQDNALNEQIRTCPTPIKVDTSNPVIDITRTIISDSGAVNPAGKIIGYANFEISANDVLSGVKVAKYAITDSPVAPDFSVIGNTNAANLGRTDGWIDFSAYSDIGVSIDLKAPGKSYVYVYVEDNAGRKYNSTVSSVTAPDTAGIYMYPETTDVVPTYLYELDVDTSTDNPVVAKDSDNMSTGVKNIFAIKNLSNITNFNLHYVNYQSNMQQSLKVDIIDCKTNEVVRTSRTLVNFAVGDTEMDDISPYAFPVWWVNGTTGQKLPSGVYEIRASILDGEDVVNSISSYAIIKQNILTQPVIDFKNLGNEVSITSTFTEDTFFDVLRANGYANSFINNFIDDMAVNHKTKYSTSLVDRLGATANTVHNPIFDADKKYAYTTSTTKFVTVVATIEDAFANIARTSQVVDFFNDGGTPLTPEQEADQQAKAEIVNNSAAPVRIIETPSAENYIVNGIKQEKDKMKENVFDFIE